MMKIGQFAAKHLTSKDTIRHYMSMGLLFPVRNGAQYEFDESCSQDYIQVTELKKIGFTLSEIQLLILYNRIGKLTEYDQRATYKSYFEKKYVQVLSDIEKLEQMKIQLKTIIVDMESKINLEQMKDHNPLGLSLTSLKLLSCPHCHGTYEIFKGSIENGLLIDATLSCLCEELLYVRNGIVYTKDTFEKNRTFEDSVDLEQYSEDYIDEYINTTHIDYLSKLHTGLTWSARHFAKEDLNEKVALELGSGHGYFMRHMIDLFPKTSTYIAVDYNPVKLRWLKQVIERHLPKCNIVFLCADFNALPIKSSAIDILLDISGSSNYAFEHTDFLLGRVNNLVKDSAKLHAFYILFDNYVSQSKIDPSFRLGFDLESIQNHLSFLGYLCEDDLLTDSVTHGGPLEDYFVSGESVRTYLYYGRKKEKP